jgi:hypothetical protein
MKNKALYIGLGVVALGGLAYFMMRKKGADAAASQPMETKSTEATPSAATTPTLTDAQKADLEKLIGGRSIVPPSPSQGRPNTPTCGCGTGQTPCPNVRCGSKALLNNKFAAKTELPQPSTAAPKADPETERFAFNLVF